MKVRIWCIIPLILLLLGQPALVHAEKRYISDTLIVSLRDSASLQGEIIAYLRSGDPLNVLEETEDGFIRVETASGEQGWLQKKYTIDEKPKDLIIAELEEKVNSLASRLQAASAKTESLKAASQGVRSEVKEKEDQIKALQDKVATLRQEVQKADEKYKNLRQQAHNVAEIVRERDALRERLKTTEQEAALLRVENAELVQTDRLLWFLSGFGVFLAGWIMGKVFRRQRRSSLSL